MGELKDYSAFARGPLRLPVNGKVYEVEPPTIVMGMLMAGVPVDGHPKIEDMPVFDFYRLVLGAGTVDAMTADNVPEDAFLLAVRAAQTDRQQGREAAVALWESGGDVPEAVAALAAAADGTETQPTTQRAAATTTRSRGSGTSTSTRRAAKKK